MGKYGMKSSGGNTALLLRISVDRFMPASLFGVL
jgi:hypothetical protein